MESVWRTAGIECADQRRPIRSVRMNAPEAPENLAAQSLGFQRAEHDASIHEHHGMQRASDVQVPDFFDVLAGAVIRIIHHEKLERDGRITLRRPETVAITRESNPPPRQGTRSHIEDAVTEMRATLLRCAEIVRPIRGARVRRERLIGQADNPPRLEMNLENV